MNGEAHVTLCYRECKGAPEPVLTGDCPPTGPCMPGEIREQYRVEILEGAAKAVNVKCRLPDLLHDGQLDYAALAQYVTRSYRDAPKNPCIVLANVRIPAGEPCPCDPEQIDITVRRVVYTNELLFDLILGLASASSDQSNQ